jgi:hypothetical protein
MVGHTTGEVSLLDQAAGDACKKMAVFYHSDPQKQSFNGVRGLLLIQNRIVACGVSDFNLKLFEVAQ